MKKNQVQFQKGMSLVEFMAHYGTEEKCRQALYKARWPQGFRCPMCGAMEHCKLKSRPIYQCNHCHHQASLIAGTIFQASKLPMTIWFLAIYLLTQSKNGISSLEMGRQLGVSQNSAWRVKHKLMQVMLERDRQRPLDGRIELDDAFWGGERHGGRRGRGAPHKTPLFAAVQTTADGKPVFMKLSKVRAFRKYIMRNWGRRYLHSDSEVVSDGLACFGVVTELGCSHHPIITGGGYKSAEHPSFRWVNTVLGNVKNALHGTYHAIRPKHLPRYLAEFNYRFNRRYHLEQLVPRLVSVAVRTPPMPERLLTLAEVPW